MALQEAEALQLMRAALENPHGTAQERSQRLLKAWSFLRRSAIPNADGDAKEEKKRLKEDRRDWRKLKRRRREEKRDNDEEEKLLLYAARLGDVEQISKLLKLGVYVSCKDDSGYSALHWASLYGHIDVVRALLCAGAGDGKRINRKTNSGNTPLHFACTGQHAEIAALLQLYKPDVYAVNEYGQTPVSLGLRNLVGKIEKEQRLAEMQALRNHSRLKLLVSESDFERQVNVGEHGQNTSETEILQKWEAYQSAWSEFVRKYGKKESGISSSVGDDGKQEINFQDVPWPLMSRKGSEVGEELLLSLLHISGNDLHSLIQQERLRWHPDKFIQLFGSQLSNLHRDAVLLGVKTVSQLLNSLANELCSNTEESKC
ncbi:uncharacterized protein [Physcomitrium patens]|uniref:uncharacterized protein isoform X2 n=1 Tax=Physcomitrium patens TaxID=3218 RepID=UPI000D17B587|nr:krev interaction trapped protein 1-like isoform X2 [Physcomitrium patens]|eukprot:XP_024372464.1 krev interaction trapped protein 1-like isoform X2 [Physcomitrella patens]